MKMRDKLGIDPALRSLPETRTYEKDPEAKRSAILRHIRENQGQELSVEDFNQVVGSTMGAVHIRKLLKEGWVRRQQLLNKGRGHHFTYFVNETPQPVSFVGRETYHSRLDPVIKAQKDHERQVQELENRIAGEAAFADKVDELSWEFLKEIDQAGEYVSGLKAFGIFLQHKVNHTRAEKERVEHEWNERGGTESNGEAAGQEPQPLQGTESQE